MKIQMLGGNTQEEINRRLQVVASAGNLSRADGTVTQVFESHNYYESNLKLARAVIGYGHKSIAEHDYICFALENVTPIVEQTIIGYRLTSFTIKSRRNVDFRNVGFYIPDFHDKDGNILENNEELKNTYTKYMQSLFNKYGDLVDEELPVEDCRYILPYSYYSNIIMGCDANELLNITSDLLYGKNSNIPELKELGLHFKKLIEENAPYLLRALDNEGKKDIYNDQYSYLDELYDKVDDLSLFEPEEVDKVHIEKDKLLDDAHLTDYTKYADKKVLCSILMNKYQLSYEDAEETLRRMTALDHGLRTKLMNSLIHSKNQRELEQVIFSFEMPISLAVLTHITRHRMHSLLVPDFVPMWNLENYVTPQTVAKDHKDEYDEIFSNNKLMYEYFKEQGVRDEDLVYFYLSGNACNIQTTMNGRALEWISRMRCCNKAQWEIRELIKKCVEDAQKVSPLLGKGLGPSCTVLGYCPEGKDSCMNRGVVVKKLERKDSNN